MSEYGKIETLYERDLSTFKVRVGELKNRTYSLLKTWHWTENGVWFIMLLWSQSELGSLRGNNAPSITPDGKHGPTKIESTYGSILATIRLRGMLKTIAGLILDPKPSPFASGSFPSRAGLAQTVAAASRRAAWTSIIV
jgi:hypothetical protein